MTANSSSILFVNLSGKCAQWLISFWLFLLFSFIFLHTFMYRHCVVFVVVACIRCIFISKISYFFRFVWYSFLIWIKQISDSKCTNYYCYFFLFSHLFFVPQLSHTKLEFFLFFLFRSKKKRKKNDSIFIRTRKCEIQFFFLLPQTQNLKLRSSTTHFRLVWLVENVDTFFFVLPVSPIQLSVYSILYSYV